MEDYPKTIKFNSSHKYCQNKTKCDEYMYEG